MNVLASSYEGRLYGFQLHKDRVFLSSKMADSSLRAIAALPSAPLVAIGGAEEFVKLIDFQNKQQKALLVHHHGHIVKIIVADPTHILIGSSDGDISIWRKISTDWVMVRRLTTAKQMACLTFLSSAVRCMAMHESKRLLISISDKQVLRLWNLMNCRCIFRQLLTPAQFKNILDVAWLGAGRTYAILSSHSVKIIETEEDIPAFQFDSVLECMLPSRGSTVLVAGEKGLIYRINYETRKVSGWKIEGVDGRIKKIQECKGYIILITTSGLIGGFRIEKLKQYEDEEQGQIDLEYSHESKLRLLNFEMVEGAVGLQHKKKKKI